jgi:hypothetical protein
MQVKKYYESDTVGCVENYKFVKDCMRKNSKYVYIGWTVLLKKNNIIIDLYNVHYKVLRLKYLQFKEFVEKCSSTPTPQTFSRFYGVRYKQFGFGSKNIYGSRRWYMYI